MNRKNIIIKTNTMIRNIFIVVALLGVVPGIVSCNSNPAGIRTSGGSDTGTAGTNDAAKPAYMRVKVRPDLKDLAYDYKKDPACGMPLKAGLEDTVHYKGKLYGFCSKECKDVFLKDPASYVAQIK